MSPKLLNIFLILIPVVLYYGFFDPMYTGNPGFVWTPQASISSLQSENIQYINALNLISDVERQTKTVNTDYTSVASTTIDKAKIMLPDSIDPLKLRAEATSIANKSGVDVEIKDVIVDTKNTSKVTGSYIITLSMKARYPLLKKLVQEFEKSKRFYTVDSLSIKRVDPMGLSDLQLLSFDKDALTIMLNYKVYYLKQ